MKKNSVIISVLLIVSMMLGMLASCTSSSFNESTTDEQTTAKETETTSESLTTSKPEDSSGDRGEESSGDKGEDSDTETSTLDSSSESDSSESTTDTDSDSDTETETEANGEIELPTVEVPEAENIVHANSLANGVNSYFEQGSNRETVIIENKNMTLKYGVSSFRDQQVSSLQNKNGGTYIENTFDVFVKTADGIFYASKTNKSTTMNLYRFGYYMYEVRLEEQNFYNGINEISSKTLKSLKPLAANNIKYSLEDDGSLSVSAKTSTDPYIIFNNVSYSADTYKYIQIVIKSDASTTRSASFYFQKKGDNNFSSTQTSSAFYMPADGEYHTYVIPMTDNESYSGDISGLRIDIDAQKGEEFSIKEIKLIESDGIVAPDLSIARSFFTYSDKMHHLAQIVAHSEVSGIEEIGLVTRIAADTVEKLVVKDKNDELHYSLDTVDWDSAEYIGFDIKDAGVFGYIIPVDVTSGKLSVTLEDGNYVIIQSRTPENGKISPSEKGTLNANDFYMGQRIYTDDSHDFDAFLHEAYCERNPLTLRKFKLHDEDSIGGAEIVGYDPLRGAYKFTLEGANGFLIPQTQTPNKHYNIRFSFSGDEYERKVYFYSSTKSGNLECAVLLDKSDLLLPIPIEVGKNFSEGESGERNIYNLDDATYGEAIFPMIIKSDEKATYTLVHLYQNWGNYPLKQISWIQYHGPYYHLSTGTTETNCIMPYYSTKNGKASLQMLPDHRAWSAPLWTNDPQHTSGGSHSMLTYTDAEGNYYSSDNSINVIGSYGPTYADVTMYHTSDDGKIKYTINHMEMPQTDENRGYYEFKYEVLEDLTIADFKRDFSFYSVTDNMGAASYTKFGYLNENNQCSVATVNTGKDPIYYVLGNECPYFDYFDMVNWTDKNGYVNVSFLVYNSEFIIGGEKSDANFVVKEFEERAYLSLNLEEITLKKGDTFTINAIIMPWGSQESEYPEAAPDYNVRDVRENTLLNPVKVTPIENCETLDSVYLPMVRSTDGQTATFTLSGGENNIAVRVYGFKKLTAPKLYEKVGNDWVEVVLSSSASPDKMGNYRHYDGYNVYFDSDGTYSYSFVTTMNDGAPRTFKIDLSKDFTRWPSIDSTEVPDLLDFYLDPNEISEVILYPEQFSSITMGSEDINFISFYGNSHVETLTESYFYAYTGGETATGGLLVLKYRLPETNTDEITNIEFYLSTANKKATNSSDSYWITGGLINDGEWHVLIVDVESFGKPTFAKNADGEFVPQYIRIDPFNKKVSNDTRFDIAFVGMAYTREDIFEICSEMDSVTLCKSSSTNIITIDPKTGKVISGDDSTVTPPTPSNPSASIDLYLEPSVIYAAIDDHAQFSKIESGVDGEIDYLSFYGNDHISTLKESYFFAYKNGNSVTGNYLVIKYRLPETNPKKVTGLEFYVSTENATATGADSFWVTSGIVNDGSWQVIIVDLASFDHNTFVADANGKYTAKYIRIDPFNAVFPASTRIDIAYIGMADTLQEIIEFNKDLETVNVCRNDKDNVIEYSTETGKPVDSEVIVTPSSVKLFFNGSNLKKKAESDRASGINSVTLSDDATYVTISPKVNAGESYVLFFDNNISNGATPKELGQYMAIKYRTSLTGERFELFAGTEQFNPGSSSSIYIGTADRGYVNDGQWHLLIIDLSTLAGYNASDDGKYYPMHIRFDLINNSHTSTADTVDVAYFGVGTSLSDLISIETELTQAYFYGSDGLKTVSVATGEEITQ